VSAIGAGFKVDIAARGVEAVDGEGEVGGIFAVWGIGAWLFANDGGGWYGGARRGEA